MEFLIQIDPRGFSKKPTQDEVRIIRKTIQTTKCDLNTLRKDLCYGHTVCPAFVDENEIFMMQQVFLVDVDAGRSVEENLRTAEKNNIIPNIIYQTFNGDTCNQKHRLVFLFYQPITDLEKRNMTQKFLTEMFGGDKMATDVKRLYYGGNACYFYNPFTVLTYSEGGVLNGTAI